MERYCNSFPVDVNKWKDVIMSVDTLPFQCVDVLGRGAQCSVYTLTPSTPPSDDTEEAKEAKEEEYTEEEETHWTEDYFKMNDVEGPLSDDSSSEGSEEESEDTEDGSGDGGDGWTNVEDCEAKEPVTIVTPSPMGSVEVVAKRFDTLDDDMCYMGCDPATKTQLQLESSSHKYVEWLHEQEGVVQTSLLTEQITDSSACYSGFVAESLCHLLISDLVARGISPHITMAFRALEWNNTGYLIQERISSTLEEIIESDPKIGAREVAALYFQIIFTLHMLQETCQLKHHDLHTDNVFVNVIDDKMVWKGQKLKDATHFSYRLDDSTVVYLPNTGYIVKIGDFGEASLDIHGRRLQRLDMDTHPKGTGWGDYTSALKGHEGYDAQVLIGAPPFEPESWRMDDKPTSTFLRHLRRVIQGSRGKLSRSRLRPLPGHVSDVTPLEVLRDVFITNPASTYDFRTPSDEPVVICLGDLADLSSESPRIPGAPKRKRRRRRSSRSEIEVKEDET